MLLGKLFFFRLPSDLCILIVQGLELLHSGRRFYQCADIPASFAVGIDAALQGFGLFTGLIQMDAQVVHRPDSFLSQKDHGMGYPVQIIDRCLILAVLRPIGAVCLALVHIVQQDTDEVLLSGACSGFSALSFSFNSVSQLCSCPMAFRIAS